MTAGSVQTLSFRVTAPMVEQFALLTGDRSSLHMDQGFARRSIFRDRVAHGMLPVSFLSLLPCFLPEKRSAALQTLSAKFISPCFIGDLLLLEARISAQADITSVDYAISNEGSTRVLTQGTAAFSLDEMRVSGNGPGSARMPLDPLPERAFAFHQIAKGDQAKIRFQTSGESYAALYRMLEMGGVRGDALPPREEWERRGDAGGFLANSLLSTYAGMCMPGRTATFTDFFSTFHRPVVLGQPHELDGRVTFKSGSAPFLTQSVAICPVGGLDPVIQSKMHVRVNEPPQGLRSARQLKESEMELGIQGRVALVTGASRGVGATIAKLLALQGAKVAVNFLKSEAEAQAVVDDILSAGGTAMGVCADVSDQEQVRRMVRTIETSFGPVEILVNNAIGDAFAFPFLDLKWGDVQKDMEIIVKGAFNCCQAVLPSMVNKRYGKIINISSSYVETPPMSQAKYVMAKSALMGLTRSLATEFAQHQIHVNVVVPSLMRTDLSQAVPKEFFDAAQRSAPLGRLASPEDVAKAVVYLASSWSSYTSGQKVMVTGGAGPYL